MQNKETAGVVTELILPSRMMQLFIHPGTYRLIRDSVKRKKKFTFSGYQINQDRCMPKDRILYFTAEGLMKFFIIGEY